MDKRTIFLEVWRGTRGFAWSERKFVIVRHFKEQYGYTYVFMGKTAVVYIGTEDYEITREEALKIATDHVKGNTITVNIDLRLCGTALDGIRIRKTPRY